jgi:hypothetical protein
MNGSPCPQRPGRSKDARRTAMRIDRVKMFLWPRRVATLPRRSWRTASNSAPSALRTWRTGRSLTWCGCLSRFCRARCWSVGSPSPWRLVPAHCVQYPGHEPGCCSPASGHCFVWRRPTLSGANRRTARRRRFCPDTDRCGPTREHPQADRRPTTAVLNVSHHALDNALLR